MTANKTLASLILGAFILCAAAPSYSDVAVKQVNIESRIVEANKDFAGDVSFLIYQNLNERDAKGEFAIAVTPQPDKKTKIEVTSLVYGRGADYRHWVPQNPQLIVEPMVDIVGAVRLTLQPQSVSKIYIDKPSAAAPIAPLLFGAIGSQYEATCGDAAASPGKVCPVTGQPLSQEERGGVAKAIDRAGMTVGMGLLASQAKGQLEGQKSVFLSDAPVSKFHLKTEAYNKDRKQLIILVTPTVADLGGK